MASVVSRSPAPTSRSARSIFTCACVLCIACVCMCTCMCHTHTHMWVCGCLERERERRGGERDLKEGVGEARDVVLRGVTGQGEVLEHADQHPSLPPHRRNGPRGRLAHLPPDHCHHLLRPPISVTATQHHTHASATDIYPVSQARLEPTRSKNALTATPLQ